MSPSFTLPKTPSPSLFQTTTKVPLALPCKSAIIIEITISVSQIEMTNLPLPEFGEEIKLKLLPVEIRRSSFFSSGFSPDTV